MTKQKLAIKQRILEYVHKNGLIEIGQKVLVAVSGGPDSVCLLHILYLLQTDLQISLHVAHLDHQLRGVESEADASYVGDLARKLGIPATIEKRDVATYQASHHLSPEEAAREVRYGFLAQTAQAVGAERIAVGHTENDQAETILLHIIRGTGTQGLRGLQPYHTMRFYGISLTVIRPLLEINRVETESYCSRLQLAPRLDASNLSLSMLRNRVRHELIPLLQSYNAGILDALLRLRRIAAEDLDYLDAETARVWEEMVSAEDKCIILNKQKFTSLPRTLQSHLLRKASEILLGSLKDVENRHIEEILDALDKRTGKMITLPDGLLFSIDYDCYFLGIYSEDSSPFPELKGVYEIKVPGKTFIPGWEIETTITHQAPNCLLKNLSKPQTPNSEYKTQFDAIPGKKGIFTACFDFAKTGDKITLRARDHGDRFQPLGMNQPKKLAAFMLDGRIPRLWRGRIPVFCCPDGIIWLTGWRIDEHVKVTDKTHEILCIKVVRVDEQYRESRENR